MIPAHIRRFGSRPAPPVDPEGHWTPVRWISKEQTCAFAGERIPAAKPGGKTGTRGTKAYFNDVLRVYECLGCRNEAVRASLARPR